MNPFAREWKTYRAAGWPGTIPLPAGRKLPPPSGCTGRTAPDPAAAQRAAWAASREYRRGNIALRLPPGVLVIDVDHHDGYRGGDLLAALASELGPLPETYRSTKRDPATPHGKLFYRVPVGPHWRPMLGNQGDGIELRHHWLAYAIVWPSVFRVLRRDRARDVAWYETLTERWYLGNEPLPDGDVPRVADLPELPAAWQERATASEPERPRTAGRVPAGRAGTAYAEAALRGELERILTASSGARHAALNRAAFSVGQLAAAGALDEERAAALLCAAAANSGIDSPGEIRRIVASGMHDGALRPRKVPA